MSLIVPRLYLGNKNDSKNLQKLKKKEITHIVNCAKGLENYHNDKFIYHNMYLHDIETEKLFPNITNAVHFINNALLSGGVVLVHCHAGISRSASTVIYYLMKKHGLKYSQAHALVEKKRNIIYPNEGFVEQLKGAEK